MGIAESRYFYLEMSNNYRLGSYLTISRMDELLKKQSIRLSYRKRCPRDLHFRIGSVS